MDYIVLRADANPNRPIKSGNWQRNIGKKRPSLKHGCINVRFLHRIGKPETRTEHVQTEKTGFNGIRCESVYGDDRYTFIVRDNDGKIVYRQVRYSR